MTYIIGAAAMLFFFIALGTALYIGYRLGQRQKAEKLSEEELKKIKKMEEGFQNILNYDYEKALQRRAK